METQKGGEKGKVTYVDSNKDLVKRVKKLIGINPTRYTQKFLGAQIGTLIAGEPYSASYVSTWLAGKCSSDKWETAVERWLEIEDGERARQRQQHFFLKNEITADVLTWLDRCWTRRVCVAVTGDPGIGKTCTIDRFAIEKPDVYRLQAGPTRADARSIEATLIDVIGEDNPELDTATNKADRLVRFFLRFPRMLIIDDFDLLYRSAFEFLLRDLWNQTSIPIFLSGNKQGIDKLKKLPAQLRSRVRHVHLDATDAFSRGVVGDFLRHHLAGHEITPGMIKLAHQIANLEGSAHLRTLLDLCDDTRDDAGEDGDAEIVFGDCWQAHPDFKLAVAKGRPTVISAPRDLRAAQPTRELVPA